MDNRMGVRISQIQASKGGVNMDDIVVKTEITISVEGNDGMVRSFLITEDMLNRLNVAIADFFDKLATTILEAWKRVAEEVIKPLYQSISFAFENIRKSFQEIGDTLCLYGKANKEFKVFRRYPILPERLIPYKLPKYRNPILYRNVKTIPYLARRC